MKELQTGQKKRRLVKSEDLGPVLLNVYGAPELIPRNEFSQPM